MDIREILAERGETHGHFPLHAYITQRMKELFRNQDNWHRLTDAQREFLDMNAHKVGRILAGDPTHNDHYKDISGYAELCVQELEQKPAPAPYSAASDPYASAALEVAKRNYRKGLSPDELVAAAQAAE